MMDRAAKRLRVLALLYAFVFFMATFGSFLDPDFDASESLGNWGVSMLSIAVALLVAWMTTRKHLERREMH